MGFGLRVLEYAVEDEGADVVWEEGGVLSAQLGAVGEADEVDGLIA